PLPQCTIFRNVAACRGSDLEKADVVALRGIVFQKAGEGLQPVLQALAIVESIHSDDQSATSETLPQSARRPRLHSLTGHVSDGLRVDTNWKNAAAKVAIKRVHGTVG